MVAGREAWRSEQPGLDPARLVFIDETGRIAPCAHTPADYGIALKSLAREEGIAALPGRFSDSMCQRRSAACADCHSTQHHGKFTALTP